MVFHKEKGGGQNLFRVIPAQGFLQESCSSPGKPAGLAPLSGKMAGWPVSSPVISPSS